jgi:hypothetical protein
MKLKPTGFSETPVLLYQTVRLNILVFILSLVCPYSGVGQFETNRDMQIAVYSCSTIGDAVKLQVSCCLGHIHWFV